MNPYYVHTSYALGREIPRSAFYYSPTTAPAEEPVTLAEAKFFARIDPTGDADADTLIDALVPALITSARASVEEQTGRSLITQTWTATLDRLPSGGIFELSHRPIQSVTSIRSYNEDGTYDEIDVVNDIVVDGDNGRVSLKSTADALSGDRLTSNFEIVYVTGYGLAADVPEWAKTSIKQMVSHWYEHRETVTSETSNEVPLGAQMLIDQNTVLDI